MKSIDHVLYDNIHLLYYVIIIKPLHIIFIYYVIKSLILI